MESIETQLKKNEIISNLEMSRDIIKRNIIANTKLGAIKNEIVKSSIKPVSIVIAIIVAYITFFPFLIFKSIFERFDFSPSILIVTGILAVIVFFVIKNYGKKLEKKVIKNRFDKKESEINDLNAEIMKTYTDCHKITTLPEKYWDTKIIDKLICYFNDKRADTLKEAINLYEDELLKLQQMNILNNISQSQKDIIRSQKVANTQLFLNSLSNISRKYD